MCQVLEVIERTVCRLSSLYITGTEVHHNRQILEFISASLMKSYLSISQVDFLSFNKKTDHWKYDCLNIGFLRIGQLSEIVLTQVKRRYIFSKGSSKYDYEL